MTTHRVFSEELIILYSDDYELSMSDFIKFSREQLTAFSLARKRIFRSYYSESAQLLFMSAGVVTSQGVAFEEMGQITDNRRPSFGLLRRVARIFYRVCFSLLSGSSGVSL